MKKFNKNVAVSLLALACTVACGSAVPAVVDSWQNTEITASAETTYEVNSLTATSGDATSINAYPNDGSGKPAGNDDWTSVYTGGSIKLNGVELESAKIKFPNDFYIDLGVTVNEGDVLTFDGSFSNAERGYTFVFNNCGLQWNGSAWVAYTAYETHNLGKLTFHVNSQPWGGAGKVSNQLYLVPASGEELPLQSWDYLFTAGSDGVFKINGEAKTASEIKSTDAGVFWLFGELKANDVITISGTFACADKKIAYVIEESSFIWNGENWEEYVAPVELTKYELGKVFATKDSNAGAVYVWPTSDVGFAATDATWTEKLTFEEGSGVGVTLNGTQINMGDIKIPGTMFIGLGATAVEGDILVIGGAFYSETLAVKYVIEESKLVYSNGAWVEYQEGNTEEPEEPETPVEPETPENTTYNLGKLTFHINSQPWGGAGKVNNQLYLVPASGEELPLKSWDYAFTAGSDGVFKINGEAKTASAIKSTGDGFFWSFDGLNADDVITISGTFVCEDAGVTYVIEESSFVWTGSNWDKYVAYETYQLGNIVSIVDANNNVGYLTFGEDVALPIDSWDYAFADVSGNGVTVNGNKLTLINTFKSVGNKIYIDGLNAEVGSVLVIGGVFTNSDIAIKYVIEDSEFTWDGTTWKSKLEEVKDEKKAALDEYRATLSNDNYYEAQLNELAALVEEGKANIAATKSESAATAALEAAKAALDEVLTKEEYDASFGGIQNAAIEEVRSYKTESDYRAEEWAVMQALVESAVADIQASESVVEVEEIVAAAKAAMDEVKTAEIRDAEDAVVNAAKAELAVYKAQADYKDAEWAEIQAIIAQANADIDEAIGDEEAISAIVAAAKVEIDAVKTAAVVDAEAYAAALKKAKDDVQAYYNGLDHSLYSEEAETQLSGYVSAAMSALNGATTAEELNTIVAQFKANVDSVAKIQSSTPSTSEEKSGCGSVIGSGLAVSGLAVAAAAVALALKKKED